MSARDALAWAQGQLGYTESPAGSNNVKYWSTVLPAFQGQPWCGAFVWNALLKGRMDTRWTTARRFVYTPTAVADAKAARMLRNTEPKPGDVVWFNFDRDVDPEHVGLIADVNDWPYSLTTVEGNTSYTGSQSNGGEVLSRVRTRTTIIGFATLAELPTPTVSEADGMRIIYLAGSPSVYFVGGPRGIVKIRNPEELKIFANLPSLKMTPTQATIYFGPLPEYAG